MATVSAGSCSLNRLQELKLEDRNNDDDGGDEEDKDVVHSLTGQNTEHLHPLMFVHVIFYIWMHRITFNLVAAHFSQIIQTSVFW